jgi:putative ABC transport system ATP-binding protein
MIFLQDVRKTYTLGDNRVEALKGINLTIERGDFVSVQGSSGSGKSTLLNILGILDSYDSGSYTLDGTPILDLSQKQAAHYRNRLIGFVFQAFNLINHKTAVENVALPLYYQGVARRERNERAMDYLERVGLAARADHKPAELSGGQAQRVAVARALITQPALLLADEPTGALDSETSVQIMQLFREVNQQGVTVLIVTHEEDIAAQTHRTIHLHDGDIARDERLA